MIEHRLIEGMLSIIKTVLSKIESEKKVDPIVVDKAVDFIRVYADQTHHGKEEDILFRELRKKRMSGDDQRIMNELIEEHVLGRRTTKALVEANARYRSGDDSALSDISLKLQSLVDFYPKHIEKEDKIFFPSARAYFTDKEDQDIIEKFLTFDQKMIHEKYKSVVEDFERALE